jgi:hypothetical protein
MGKADPDDTKQMSAVCVPAIHDQMLSRIFLIILFY